MNWSEFKIRHEEMMFVLLFIKLVNLFDRKLYNFPDGGCKCFRS